MLLAGENKIGQLDELALFDQQHPEQRRSSGVRLQCDYRRFNRSHEHIRPHGLLRSAVDLTDPVQPDDYAAERWRGGGPAVPVGEVAGDG